MNIDEKNEEILEQSKEQSEQNVEIENPDIITNLLNCCNHFNYLFTQPVIQT